MALILPAIQWPTQSIRQTIKKQQQRKKYHILSLNKNYFFLSLFFAFYDSFAAYFFHFFPRLLSSAFFGNTSSWLASRKLSKNHSRMFTKEIIEAWKRHYDYMRLQRTHAFFLSFFSVFESLLTSSVLIYTTSWFWRAYQLRKIYNLISVHNPFNVTKTTAAKYYSHPVRETKRASRRWRFGIFIYREWVHKP